MHHINLVCARQEPTRKKVIETHTHLGEFFSYEWIAWAVQLYGAHLWPLLISAALCFLLPPHVLPPCPILCSIKPIFRWIKSKKKLLLKDHWTLRHLNHGLGWYDGAGFLHSLKHSFPSIHPYQSHIDLNTSSENHHRKRKYNIVVKPQDFKTKMLKWSH